MTLLLWKKHNYIIDSGRDTVFPILLDREGGSVHLSRRVRFSFLIWVPNRTHRNPYLLSGDLGPFYVKEFRREKTVRVVSKGVGSRRDRLRCRGW